METIPLEWVLGALATAFGMLATVIKVLWRKSEKQNQQIIAEKDDQIKFLKSLVAKEEHTDAGGEGK